MVQLEKKDCPPEIVSRISRMAGAHQASLLFHHILAKRKASKRSSERAGSFPPLVGSGGRN
jgi:hypothetical protein